MARGPEAAGTAAGGGTGAEPTGRTARYADLVPGIDTVTAVVVGCGAIGSQLTRMLAAAGVTQLHLYDPDSITPENLGTQGWKEADVGMTKVDTLAGECLELNADCRVRQESAAFPNTAPRDWKRDRRHVVFMCVDTMEARKFVWEACRPHAAAVFDARMNAFVIRVFSSDNPDTDAHYDATLFPDAEAQEGRCTARGTVFTAAVAAGLVFNLFTAWLRGERPYREQTLNLRSGELTTTE